MPKRIMVDMSVTLLHHGHIRLLKKAAELGSVVVALTTDEEVEKTKGCKSILTYEERKEILAAVRYVDEVVPCPWLIDENFLDKHNCELLVHGDDNSNPIPPERLRIFTRTCGISSSDMRERILNSYISPKLNNKLDSCSAT